ncbi:MAG: hypothetical protein HY716_02025 [Planctomycetes bacterium]|nr:hypothetical protein [Planctomycetota bacterium]
MVAFMTIRVAAGFLAFCAAHLETRNFHVPAEATRQEEKFDEWRKLHEERSKKTAEADALHASAREALLRDDYDTAIADHKRSRALRAEAAALGKAMARLVPEVAREALRNLKEGDAKIRDRALVRLQELGPAAVPELIAFLKSNHSGLETQARVRRLVKNLDDVEILGDGQWAQWAVAATGSSEFGKDSYGARQACGKPNTMRSGDFPTAWASEQPNGGKEWLELTYEFAVRPARVRVRVHETFNPGALIRIEARDEERKWRVLWEGKDTTQHSPGWLDVRFDPPKFATRVIRITLDTSSVTGWNEIDAVQIFGKPAAGE